MVGLCTADHHVNQLIISQHSRNNSFFLFNLHVLLNLTVLMPPG